MLWSTQNCPQALGYQDHTLAGPQGYQACPTGFQAAAGGQCPGCYTGPVVVVTAASCDVTGLHVTTATLHFVNGDLVSVGP